MFAGREINRTSMSPCSILDVFNFSEGIETFAELGSKVVVQSRIFDIAGRFQFLHTTESSTNTFYVILCMEAPPNAQEFYTGVRW